MYSFEMEETHSSELFSMVCFLYLSTVGGGGALVGGAFLCGTGNQVRSRIKYR